MWAAFVAAVFIVGAAVVSVQAGASNASVTLKKETSGLFTLTINDPDGIQSFSLVPSGKGPYGGEITKCPRTFQNTNVLFTDPSDFTPVMPATVTDCQGNTDELEIPPPDGGATRSKRLKPPVPPPPPLSPEPTPPPATERAAEPASRPARSEAETEAAKAKISYPVSELGNCGSEAACRAYCEELAHIKACVAFAETHSLMTAAEAEQGRRFAEIGGKGPGGCTSRESCAAYCEDVSRIEECLKFAEENNFLSGDELREVRAVAKVKREGVAFPGGCTSKAACETYCQEANHIEECLSFAERSGLIPPEELAMAKKFLPLIQAGKTPGGCTRKETCEAYCQRPANMRACLAFAEEQGLIPAEELEMAKKFLPLMEKGETPGGCRSKETCEAYCGEAGHMEECISFGEKTGFISKEDAELARRNGGMGPGGCRSKAQCEIYCGDPAHVEECVSFAERSGLINAEDAEFARQAGGMGPGGCRSREECEKLCSDPAHSEECVNFSVRAGQIEPEEAAFAKTLNCRSREECIILCKQPENAEKCAALAGGSPQGSPDRGPIPDGGAGPESIRGEIQRQIQEETQRQIQGETQQKIQGETQRQIQEETERRIREETERLSPPGGIPPSDHNIPPPPTTGGPQPTSRQPYEYKADCSLFAAAPQCSFVGPVGSQNYNLCVQCFPDRAGPAPVTPPSSAAPASLSFGLLIAPFLELLR